MFYISAESLERITRELSANYRIEKAPQVGLEPTTLRLTVAGTGFLPMTVDDWDVLWARV
jgi:hypothetical protein